MALTLTDLTAPPGFQRLVLAQDPQAGLRALICLHSTALGPAAGGCRMWAYPDDEAAIHDVTRLARGMTYKNAMADLGLGGGKAVIIGDARTDKTPAMMRAFGAAVDALGGTYWTAEDVGISPADMAHAAEATRFAVGLSGASGDPSPWTAEGVFRCLRVGARHVFGSDDLTGRRVLVQGLGHVGLSLAEKLAAAGAWGSSLIPAEPDAGTDPRGCRGVGRPDGHGAGIRCAARYSGGCWGPCPARPPVRGCRAAAGPRTGTAWTDANPSAGSGARIVRPAISTSCPTGEAPAPPPAAPASRSAPRKTSPSGSGLTASCPPSSLSASA